MAVVLMIRATVVRPLIPYAVVIMQAVVQLLILYAVVAAVVQLLIRYVVVAAVVQLATIAVGTICAVLTVEVSAQLLLQQHKVAARK